MGHDHDHSEPSWQVLLTSAACCGICTLAGIAFERAGNMDGAARTAYVLAFLCGGWDAAVDTWGRLFKLSLDIHFLMLAVAVGAAAIGCWWEGAALLFLFSLSNALEALAGARTEREIRALLNDTPKTATVVAGDGTETQVPADKLIPGQIVRVLPDSQFPADATVVSGLSAADESSLTGESEPVEKQAGDAVYGGTLNTYGPLLAEVSRPPSESAHARIIRLIRDAQASKAPSQRFTDRFGTHYTLGVLGLTLVMFLFWHYVRGLSAFAEVDGERSAFYRAMTLLVVCSPCALVISIPSAILTGIAAGARRGILFRGGVALGNLGTIGRLAMDKTGTLTKGELQIVAIEASVPGAGDEVLRTAAPLCQLSTHPVSRAVACAWRQRFDGDLPAAAALTSLPGNGLRAEHGGRTVLLGRRTLFTGNEWIQGLPDPEPGLTEMLVSAEHISGRILLRDTPRAEAAGLIDRLKARGIRVTMLTGDRQEAADLIARGLGLDDVRAGLSPEGKVAAIQEWRAAGERVAMAGDGVNDAPSLAAADVSIGMGLRGSDAVLEQADVVLTQDKLERVLEALDLSCRCRSVIRQNVAVSLGLVLLLGLSALGTWIPLPLGVLGHEGSTVLVVLNSLRLLWRRE